MEMIVMFDTDRGEVGINPDQVVSVEERTSYSYKKQSIILTTEGIRYRTTDDLATTIEKLNDTRVPVSGWPSQPKPKVKAKPQAA